MPDSGGMLQSFTLAKTLSLVPAPLLISALIGVAASLLPRARSGGRDASLLTTCAAAALLSFALAVFHAVPLLLAKSTGYLGSHLALALRIGSFDASIALTLDRLAAPPLLAVTAIGAAVLLVVAIATRRSPPSASTLAMSCLLVAAMQTLLLASGFFLLLVSWSAVVVSSLVLLGHRAVSAAAAIAQVLLVAAASLLFWLYGGGWHGGEYAAVLRPRVIAVQLVGAPAAPATGSAKGGLLSMRALPGTRIGLAGAELCAPDASGRAGGVGFSARPCREPAQSPFARLPIPAAIHDFHLFAGHGTNELELKKVRIEAGRETLLTLVGPTLDFRELADQLGVSELLGEKAVRRTLQRAEIFGLPGLSIALLLVVLAAATQLFAVPKAWARALPQSSPAAVALITGFAAVPGVYLLARLDFLATSTPWIAAIGTVGGCALAVRAAARTLIERDLRRSTLLLAVAHGGIAFGGVAAGAAESSVFYLAVGSSAACAFALALGGEGQDPKQPIKLDGARARARWFSALALSAAPLPLLGVMLARVSSDEGVRSLPGALALALLLAGSVVISFAAWCSHYRALGGVAKAAPRAASNFSAHAACALAALSLAGGVIGGYLQGFDPSRIGVLASLALPLYGWVAARRRYSAAGGEPAPSPFLRWLGTAPSGLMSQRRASGWGDSIGAMLLRIEQVLYAPLESTKAAERAEGER